MVPESYDNIPQGFIEDVFHKMTGNEIRAAVSKDLINGNYDQEVGLAEIDHRLLFASQNTNKLIK